jgi:hypothetical protein
MAPVPRIPLNKDPIPTRPVCFVEDPRGRPRLRVEPSSAPSRRIPACLHPRCQAATALAAFTRQVAQLGHRHVIELIVIQRSPRSGYAGGGALHNEEASHGR